MDTDEIRTLLDRSQKVATKPFVTSAPKGGLARDALEAESVREALLFIEIRHK